MKKAVNILKLSGGTTTVKSRVSKYKTPREIIIPLSRLDLNDPAQYFKRELIQK